MMPEDDGDRPQEEGDHADNRNDTEYGSDDTYDESCYAEAVTALSFDKLDVLDMLAGYPLLRRVLFRS